MAKSETSKPNSIRVGNSTIVTRTKITDNGNNNYSLEVIRYDPNNLNAGTVIAQTDQNGTLKSTANATSGEQAAIQDSNSQLRKEVINQKDSIASKLGVNTPEQKAAFNKLGGGSGNKATASGNQPPQPTAQDQQEFITENDSFREGTREEYGNCRYPLDLAIEYQDCIKFTILKYTPSLSKGNETIDRRVKLQTITSNNRSSTIPTIAGSTRLGTITLPIPAGINDSNTVSWQDNPLDDLQKAMGEVATGALLGGVGGGTAAAEQNMDRAQKGSGEIAQGLAGKFASMAARTDKLQQRTYGSMFNNNLELLFNGPSLRSFGFTFKLSPRNPAEAKEIMKIIRFFKQAMSVKRSKQSFLLKSPHTFAISYLTSNKQHPYLNKFKECALTGFNVDYTPDGQYMTYMSSNVNERSMISYNISLSFQELDPVFDDEYGRESPNALTGIGY